MPIRAEAQEDLDWVNCRKPESDEQVVNYDKHLAPVIVYTVPGTWPSSNFLDDPVK